MTALKVLYDMVTWKAPANMYYVPSVTRGKVLVLTFPNNLSRPTYSWFRFAPYLNDGRASILAFNDEFLNLQVLTPSRNTCKNKFLNSKTCLRTPPPQPTPTTPPQQTGKKTNQTTTWKTDRAKSYAARYTEAAVAYLFYTILQSV